MKKKLANFMKSALLVLTLVVVGIGVFPQAAEAVTIWCYGYDEHCAVVIIPHGDHIDIIDIDLGYFIGVS